MIKGAYFDKYKPVTKVHETAKSHIVRKLE